MGTYRKHQENKRFPWEPMENIKKTHVSHGHLRKTFGKKPKLAPEIDPKSIKNRRVGAVPASRIAKRGFWGSGVHFQVFGGTPEGQNSKNSVEKTALPNA